MKTTKAPRKNQHTKTNVQYNRVSSGNNILYRNIDQVIIETTADKLLIKLQKYVKKQEKRLCWIAPFSIFVSIGLTLSTTKTKDFLGISADKWTIIHIVLLFIIFFWFVVSSILAIKNNETPETFVKSFQNSNPLDPISLIPIRTRRK